MLPSGMRPAGRMPRPWTRRQLCCSMALLAACIHCMHLPKIACASAQLAAPSTNRASLSLNVSNSTGCKDDQCRLKIDITYPIPSHSTPDKAPVIVVFSGFVAVMSYYHYLATALAAHGYVVVQYQTTATLADVFKDCLHGDWQSCATMGNITDALELKFLAPVLQYSEEYALKRPDLSFADFSTIALLGHSRGGKLATLHYGSGDPRYKTALLLDPVDATRWTPVDDNYPSGVANLTRHPRTLAIVGAGVGWDTLFDLSCNPPASNSTQFAKYAAPGNSYYLILPSTGHMQFIHSDSHVEWGFNLMCRPFNGNNTMARDVAVALAVAWMDQELRNGPPLDGPGSGLCALVKALGPSQALLQKKGADGRWREAACQRSVDVAPT